MYQIPYATYALEDYDIENPDFSKFPALDGVEGIECYLEHGDTLFMPTGWWHWMKYLDGSFSISLRAWDKSWGVKAHSLWNLTVQRKFDNFMKSRYKKRYMDWKEKKAFERANIALKKRPSNKINKPGFSRVYFIIIFCKSDIGGMFSLHNMVNFDIPSPAVLCHLSQSPYLFSF